MLKLDEDAKLVSLAGNVSAEIPDDDILESLKTLSVEEQRKSPEKATMMEIDGKPMPKVVVLEFLLPHSTIEVKRVELDELKRIQSTTEHGPTLMSLYVAKR